MSLADYLAKNYLNADDRSEKKSKKRKRKGTAAPTEGLIIEDEDNSWRNGKQNEEDDDGPTTISGQSIERRKLKKSGWKTVGSAAPSNAEQAAADAIIASAAAENSVRAGAEDEAPTVEDSENIMKMESGAFAGLQTAAQVEAAIKIKEREEREAYGAASAARSGKEHETIYRDASGRIINVAMKRAEARKKAEEEERKKVAEVRMAKGDVQLAEQAARKQQLKDAKYMTLSRYADDEELNDKMKDKDRWNDPAAGFLVKKKEGRSVTGKPLYKGAAAPNRYGIRPGYRWDGVDRSNGFEKEYFAAKNKKVNRQELEYAWQMDA
ncbi:hypothetical protein EJ05DRAFT_536132 [Pseudovirgaria hyperparasitica]|uniref:Pre-mRNA-splicing factor CWC26 n=1 Tax=Pseudovirgaria hyperparasitica TaxID=470096 RepID=A0A6A6WH03_9PEZI|nr:uncharacterized protein EJ05DRAFT_536132 [Pseudovirgaria hyperparasitica]KAF2761340.1 hypothetical protein EJ05DRAFT_536132 [Pseudovirgaria hyperparasitica]